jgi:general secretion pathway protein I
MKIVRCNCIKPRGFTLMEVLVALLIVSLGMLGVIQAVSQAASNTSYLRDKTIAHWVAMNRITELRLQSQPPQLGESSGSVEMSGREWRWSTVVERTAIDTMSKIDVSVALKEDEDSSLATVSGFFGTAIAPPNSPMISWQSAMPVANQPPGAPPPGPGTPPPTPTLTPPPSQPDPPPPTGAEGTP